MRKFNTNTMNDPFDLHKCTVHIISEFILFLFEIIFLERWRLELCYYNTAVGYALTSVRNGVNDVHEFHNKLMNHFLNFIRRLSDFPSNFASVVATTFLKIRI